MGNKRRRTLSDGSSQKSVSELSEDCLLNLDVFGSDGGKGEGDDDDDQLNSNDSARTSPRLRKKSFSKKPLSIASESDSEEEDNFIKQMLQEKRAKKEQVRRLEDEASNQFRFKHAAVDEETENYQAFEEQIARDADGDQLPPTGHVSIGTYASKSETNDDDDDASEKGISSPSSSSDALLHFSLASDKIDIGRVNSAMQYEFEKMAPSGRFDMESTLDCLVSGKLSAAQRKDGGNCPPLVCKWLFGNVLHVPHSRLSSASYFELASMGESGVLSWSPTAADYLDFFRCWGLDFRFKRSKARDADDGAVHERQQEMNPARMQIALALLSGPAVPLLPGSPKERAHVFAALCAILLDEGFLNSGMFVRQAVQKHFSQKEDVENIAEIKQALCQHSAAFQLWTCAATVRMNRHQGSAHPPVMVVHRDDDSEHDEKSSPVDLTHIATLHRLMARLGPQKVVQRTLCASLNAVGLVQLELALSVLRACRVSRDNSFQMNIDTLGAMHDCISSAIRSAQKTADKTKEALKPSYFHEWYFQADCIIFAYNTLLSLSRACIDKGAKKLGLKRSYASMLDKVGKMEGALKDQFHLAFSTLSTTLQMQMKPCNRYSHEFSAYYGSGGDFNHDGTPVKQKMQATLTTFFPSSQ